MQRLEVVNCLVQKKVQSQSEPAIADCGLADEVHTTKTLCNGRCKDGPIVISQPDGIWFKKMVKEEAEGFVREYLVEQFVPPDKVLYQYGQSTIYAGEQDLING
jgi:(2Fe-2S) ferredoxin